MAYSNTKGITGLSGQFNDLGFCEHNVEKCLKVNIDVPNGSLDLATTNEVVIAAALPRAFVTRVLLDITTLEVTGTTKTLDIGTATADAGDPNGFVAAGSSATAACLVGAGALVGTVCPAGDRIVVDLGSNDWAEFVADLYIFYIEV